MIKQTCTLKFSQGETVTAEVTAASPEEFASVEYSGDVARLPRRHEKVNAAVLRIFFQNLALELGAEYSESAAGEYETWAE
jgi:hypothetical protein